MSSYEDALNGITEWLETHPDTGDDDKIRELMLNVQNLLLMEEQPND